MKTLLPFFLVLSLLAVAPTAREQATPASPTANAWQALQHPAFPQGKTATVTNLTLTRDRIKIILATGTIQFAEPANGMVFAAAFRGSGVLQVTPPNPLEAQQLELFLKQGAIDMHFTDATFNFTDKTYAEIAAQVEWAPAASTGGNDLAKLYWERQQQREEAGYDLKRKLLRSLFSEDHARTALFFADLKTSEKGWMTVNYDALGAEEIKVEHWIGTSLGRDTDTWMNFPAGGRSSSEAYADPFAKEDYHILGYVIDARVTSGAELSAVTKVKAESRLAGERVWIFELNSNLRIEKITDEKGRTLEFYQSRERKDRAVSYGEIVAVVFPEATQKEVKTLEFRYAGKRVVRQEGPGNYFCPSEGWYPGRGDSFDSRADFDITFRSPKKFTLVATGNKESDTVDGNEQVTVWKTDKPLAVAGFAYGDYKVITENAGDVFVDIYANREPDEIMQSLERIAPAVGSLTPAILAKPMASEFANAVRLFENYFGAYPFKRLSVTTLPVSFSYGQGWPGLIYLWSASFLDDQQRHQLLQRADPIEVTDYFRAHETSHMWWGHQVGWKSYHDQWMSEGFAQFSGNLYVQYRDNMKEYQKRLRKDKEDIKAPDLHSRPYESVGPVWMGARLSSSESPDAYEKVIYRKGGYILHMLRMMIYDPRNGNNPEQRFKEMMHDYCATYANKAASTEDFKAIVEKHMSAPMDLENNHRMDWFFRQYVYGTGIPKYEFHYDVQDGGGGQFKVSGAVTRTGGPETWMDVLPLYVHQGKESRRVGSLRAAQKTSPFQFMLPFRPDKVSLNDNEDTLADIKQ